MDSEEDDVNFNDSDYSLVEDGDVIFEQYVSQDIELYIRKEIIIASNDPSESDGLEYVSSDDLRSLHSDSEDDIICYPRFNAEKNMMDPEFEAGLKFKSKEEIIRAAKNLSIQKRFEVIFPYNERSRGDGHKKMRCSICGQLGHNKKFHSKNTSTSQTNRNEGNNEPSAGPYEGSVEYFGDSGAPFSNSQPSCPRDIMNEKAPIYSQAIESGVGLQRKETGEPSASKTRKKDSAPRRWVRRSAPTTSTPTLRDKWKSMLQPYKRENA